MGCLLTTHKAAWYIISVDSVCLSVCQTITFESFDVWKFIFAHPVHFQVMRVKFVPVVDLFWSCDLDLDLDRDPMTFIYKLDPYALKN